MDLTTAATGFAAMGSGPRLSVLQCLVKAGKRGLLVGDIQRRTGIPGSTLAHHLRALSDAGLIAAEKNGRTVINRARYDHLEALAAYILEECCAEEVGQDD